jgi:hypothetical protein
VSTRDEYREAAREWIDAQAAYDAMQDDQPITLQALGEALDRLDAAGEKAITLARQMMAEASERARRQR